MNVRRLGLAAALLLAPGAPRAQAPLSRAVFEGVAIEGSRRFVDETIRALAALKKARHLDQVKRSVSAVREAKCSGMNVYAAAPTYEVGGPTWRAGVVWYAGTIAHDSFHSWLYHRAKALQNGREPAYEEWAGTRAEKRCLAFQMLVLRDLQAAPSTLGYVKRTMKAPTYQKIGEGKPDPCVDRSW